jgi:predicted ferric reductase
MRESYRGRVHVRQIPALGASDWRRAAGLSLLWAVLLGNAAVIVWLWVHGGNLHVRSTGDLLTAIGRLTGLLGAYLALIQVVLLARLSVLERLVGFDRLTVWHRWNGHVCIDLIVAHVIFTVWGYALLDRIPLGKEITTMLGGGIYPGMITATVGTGMLLAVVATSVVIVRRRLRYEWWYTVHLLAYGGIALSWFHEIPTGNDLVLNRAAADYWRALYIFTLAVLLIWRVLVPLAGALRYRLRVAEVTAEGGDVVSLRITGRQLGRLRAQPGQFFLWRFLAPRAWGTAHPFSLSAAPDGQSLRITVKGLGDHSSRMAEIEPGTRVLAEGPFGLFTDARRHSDRAVLIAGGIGITPIRALIESMHGDVIVLYRVVREEDVIFRDELAALASANGTVVHYLVGDHMGEGRDLLSPGHLLELVPDLVERDVFVCGPPAMAAFIRESVRAARVPRRQVHAERFALT